MLGYVSRESATIEIGVAILLAGVIYLLFRKRILDSSAPSLPESKSLALVLNIIFFSTFAASLLLMHHSLHRPLVYFLLTSIAAAVVAAEIFSANAETKTGLLLFKILLIAFSLRYGLLYDFPGFYGVDPWWHAVYVEDWIRDGHIAPFSSIGYTSYAYYPGMHLNIMATRIITLANPKDSLFLSIGLPYIISVLFVFLLGQRLINTRTGLLAALFISIDLHHIIWGAWLIPTSMGTVVLAILLWMIFKGTTDIFSTLLTMIISLLMIFTHTLSPLIIGVILVLMLGANHVYGRLFKVTGEKIRLGLNFVILFWVGMLTSWLYLFFYSPGSSFFDSVFSWLFTALKTDAQFTGAAFAASTESAIPLLPLNRIGFLMLISFIVLGSLYWLSEKAIDNKRVAIIVSALGLSIVTFVTPLFNIKNLIPERWLPFISVLAAPIVAEGIVAISRVTNGKLRKSAFMMFVVLTFSVLMINNQGVNIYTPFYGKDYMEDPQRYAFNESELSVVDTIPDMYDGVIVTDSPYAVLPFKGQIGTGRVKDLSTGTESDGLVIIRKYIYSHRASVGLSDEQLNNWTNSVSNAAYDTVYDNGEVKAYSSR